MPKTFNRHDHPFSVYITPLYNGEVGGRWLSFPTDADTVRRIFSELNIGPHDWEGTRVDCNVPGLRDKLQQCYDLDEFNLLANLLVDMDYTDFVSFCAIAVGDDFETVDTLINLCTNLEAYDINFDVTTTEELGHYYVHNSNLDRYTLDALDGYIDYEAYGADIAEGQNGQFYDDCYVVTISNPEQWYLGTVPDEYVVTNKIAMPELDEDMRLEQAIALAMEIDQYLSYADPSYDTMHPDVIQRQQTICDNLYEGQIAIWIKRLEDFGCTDSNGSIRRALAHYQEGIRYDPDRDHSLQLVQALVVEPQCNPYMEVLSVRPEDLNAKLYGPTSVKYPFDDRVALIYNSEAKDRGEDLNRALFNKAGQPYEVIAGTFLLVGQGDGGYVSLTDEQLEHFAERFDCPELFAQVGDRTVVFQMPREGVSALSPDELSRMMQSGKEVKPLSVRERLEEAKRGVHTGPFPCLGRSKPEHEL